MDSHSQGTALITGASSGIGAVYADRLARRGHDLILVARNRERLDALGVRIAQDTGRSVEVLVANLTSNADRARVEQRLRSDGRITTLVNNAGFIASGRLTGADLDLHESMIQLNAVAVMRLTCAALPGFTARGYGVVINIGSITSLMPETFKGTYSATKAFVLSFTQSLQAEVGGRGIRVQAVLPGGTRTELWERGGFDVASFPSEVMMDVDEMVDAALAGFDQGELITIPSLPEARAWTEFDAARLALGPSLSRSHPAKRYQVIEHGSV